MKEVLKASSWSIMTEIIAKVITPISFLVLTRILSPEDFGVVTVATTFVSFIYIISDLGVSKVIIQNPRTDDQKYLYRLNNTCFWFSTFFGLLLLFLTILFSQQISIFFGNEKSSLVVKVMASQIIFYSLSSVQNAILKKELKFKFLFFTRMVTIGMPIILSIPIALLGGGYWAIVIGTVVGSFLNTVVLWVYSDWKPKLVFDSVILKDILGKSIWSSFDEIIIWIPIGLDAYLIGNYLGAKDLGLYTTARTLFSAAIALSLGAILPVLYSHLSRIQKNNIEFKKTIMFSQRIIYTLAAYIGLSVYILSDFIEVIIFDDRWVGISDVMGVIFLIMSNGYFYSVLQEGLRSRGHFKELFMVKFLSIFIIVPFLFYAVKVDLVFYSMVRSLVLFTWIFGVFHYARKKLGVTFISFVENSKNILAVVIIVPIIIKLLELHSESLHFSLVTFKITIFFIMSFVILYLERSIFQKIVAMARNR